MSNTIEDEYELIIGSYKRKLEKANKEIDRHEDDILVLSRKYIDMETENTRLRECLSKAINHIEDHSEVLAVDLVRELKSVAFSKRP